MHPKLARQLRKVFGSVEAVPRDSLALIALIDQSYAASDVDRGLLERSLDLMSKEMVGRYSQALENLKTAQASTTELEETRAALLNALEDTQAMQTSLQASEAEFRTVFETADVGISIVDQEGRIMRINPAYGRMLGYTSEEFIGKTFESFTHPDDRVENMALFREVASGKRSGFRMEKRYLHKNGSVVWGALLVSPLGMHGTKVNRVLGLAVNITERKKSEVRIEELNFLRNKFIQIVSHQLRTPLSSIRWNLEMLLSGGLGRLKPEQRAFISMTHLADVEVLNRIHDLLTAMDIEEGRVLLTREKTSLESLWNSVMADWKSVCDLKEITCTYEPPGTPLPGLFVDSEKIRHVFMKLMENSVSYTNNGGKVTARMAQADGRVRFEIADTGIGIPKVEQAKIFTRFYRASNASTMKPDASGLGLSIAKFFIEQHDGKIGFTSKEGKGSTFWFDIPVV